MESIQSYPQTLLSLERKKNLDSMLIKNIEKADQNNRYYLFN